MATQTQTELERLLLEREIERFLYAEAELLDERKFSEWLDLMADDVHYFMPQRRNVKFGEQARENSDPESEISWFDEGKVTLAGRVRQLNTGLHWAEEPLSRVCHIISSTCARSARSSTPNGSSRWLRESLTASMCGEGTRW